MVFYAPLQLFRILKEKQFLAPLLCYKKKKVKSKKAHTKIKDQNATHKLQTQHSLNTI